MNPLGEEEKMALYRCIRYSFISDETLMRSNVEPTFSLAREFIVQGLGSKLGNQENEDLPKKKKIDRNPRNCNLIQQMNENPPSADQQQMMAAHQQQQASKSQMDWRLAEGIKEQKKADNFLAQNPYNKAASQTVVQNAANQPQFKGQAQVNNNLLAQTVGPW